MASVNYVPSIDYTSRDYSSILSDMTTLIPNFSPEWTTRDPADFGMTLLELFAYMGDILNYYIDRTANESFITTATQRKSVLELSTLLGYTPSDATASTVTLTFQNSTASSITLPAKTQVATSLVANSTTTQVIFETDTAVTVPAKVGAINGSATVKATQGQTISNETIGISNGTPSQTFALFNKSVLTNSISIAISGITYQQVDYLIDSSGFSPVFSSFTNAENVTYITFGDSVSGRIPPNGASITATYRIGGGAIGNVATGTIKFILSVPGLPNVPTGITVSNQDVSVPGDGAAIGGADEETTDSIRINAPLSIRAIDRAVSLTDYAALTVQVDGISKAIATADVYSSVTVYFAPTGDPGVATDNVTPTTVFNNLATTAAAYLAGKAPANTTITFQPPKYAGVKLIVNITVAPQFKQVDVINSVQQALTNLFDYNNVVFKDTIYVSDVYNAIAAANGVVNQRIVKLVRSDSDQTFTINNKALSSNVATLTTSVNHNLKVGQTVSVTGVDSTFNGTFVVTGVTSNTFSYSLVAGTISSTAATGSVNALTVTDIVCATNEIPSIYIWTGIGSLTVNASGGIVI